jgi:glycosyltransferase involved in cell wall biosynthesis
MSKITVVTICFNNLHDLVKTCQSVDGQSQHPIEHWIIDGSTSKDIAQWLQQNEQPVYRKWICEPDKGIADAFNKGIAKATGDVIQLLNSGDIYASEKVLEHVGNAFSKDQTLQWLTGMINMIRVGAPVVVGKPFDPSKLYRGMRSVSHPTWFVKRTVYHQVGIYDSSYAIAMDYEMMCRLKKFKSGFLPIPFVVFDDTGVSTNNYFAALSETKKAYRSHFGFSFPMELWQFRLKLLHLLQQTALGKFLFNLKRKLGLENM